MGHQQPQLRLAPFVVVGFVLFTTSQTKAATTPSARLHFPLTPSIWPNPIQFSFGDDIACLDENGIAFEVTKHSNPTLLQALTRFQNIWFRKNRRTPIFKSKIECSTVIQTVGVAVTKTASESLDLGIDEQYSVEIVPPLINITASTVYGAMHALETISQLVFFISAESATESISESSHQYVVPHVPIKIRDAPEFKWRGFLVDTARHYLSPLQMFQIIDSLAIHKFNVLHWHVIDSQSFPLEIPTRMELSRKGSYDAQATFSPRDVAAIVTHGQTRGVRVVMELDSPGHTFSWGHAYPSLIACPQDTTIGSDSYVLDVSQPMALEVMRDILEHVMNVTIDKFIHLGGDEVAKSCLDQSKSFKEYVKTNKISYSRALQQWFKGISTILKPRHKTSIVWEEAFFEESAPTDAVIQIWKWWDFPQNVIAAATAHRKMIISSSFYLDNKLNWEELYNPETSPIFPPFEKIDHSLILGAEACLWAEKVNSFRFELMAWPGGAAVAERLWTEPSAIRSASEATPRLKTHLCYLASRGIASAPIGPGYCASDFFTPHTAHLNSSLSISDLSSGSSPSSSSSSASELISSHLPCSVHSLGPHINVREGKEENDQASSNPNEHSGRCVCHVGWQGGLCDVCADDYFGIDCAPCPPGSTDLVCSGHGVCDDGKEGSGKCVCERGWSGSGCEHSEPSLASSEPSATNVNANTRTAKQCLSGEFECVSWRQTGGCSSDGPREPLYDRECSMKIWHTQSGFCECSNGKISGKFDCQQLRDPFTCDQMCMELSALNGHGGCGEHGTCNVNTGECDCNPSWAGNSCSVCASGFFGADCQDFSCRKTDGSGMKCSGHGTCTEQDLCDCDLEYSGIACSQPVNNNIEASQQRQQNVLGMGTTVGCDVCVHGQCVTVLDIAQPSALCTCNVGWAGSECNQCAVGYFGKSCQMCPGNARCFGHGVCSDGLDGSGKCECLVGWTGDDCNTSNTINSEFSGSSLGSNLVPSGFDINPQQSMIYVSMLALIALTISILALIAQRRRNLPHSVL